MITVSRTAGDTPVYRALATEYQQNIGWKHKGFNPDMNPGAVPQALRPWFNHLQEFRRTHPAMSMKAAMRAAARTYHKTKSNPAVYNSYGHPVPKPMPPAPVTIPRQTGELCSCQSYPVAHPLGIHANPDDGSIGQTYYIRPGTETIDNLSPVRWNPLLPEGKFGHVAVGVGLLAVLVVAHRLLPGRF